LVNWRNLVTSLQAYYGDLLAGDGYASRMVRAADVVSRARLEQLESGRVNNSSADLSAESNATYRTVALHLIPILILCYFSAYIDRSNIGIAKLEFTADLHFDEATYGLAGGLFYLGYSLFEVPSALMLRRAGARRTFFRILLLWSLFSAALAWIRTPAEFYALRFLIGVAEAGFFPGVLYYLSHWVPAARRARFTAWFLSSITLTGIIGGPLAGFLLHTLSGTWNLKGWQWLFIVEGLPGMLLALLLLRVLRDSPASAEWLSAEQKALIQRDLNEDVPKAGTEIGVREIALSSALRDRKFYALAFMSSSVIAGAAGISLWMPTVLRHAGFASASMVAVLTAIPYAAALVAQQWVAHRSDRRQERRWHAALSGLLAAAGWAATLFATGPIPTLICLSIAAAGTFAATGPFWSLPPSYLSGRGAAVGIAMITTCGGVASFVSPIIVGSAARYWHSDLIAPAYYSLLLGCGSVVLLWGTRAHPA
jgi:sugar phosphate permease